MNIALNNLERALHKIEDVPTILNVSVLTVRNSYSEGEIPEKIVELLRNCEIAIALIGNSVDLIEDAIEGLS